ncbi:hypothetical protein [Burkholderia glumae]|uniref:hypothetical protein n=1 Tax=Burkholderia glumae TaxID=337 RepID=UPI0015943A35|nr:hypothetical protein [Burkholderia glumae]NVE22355.1 hypothetical protein [Burkholderia glumae]
MRRPKQLKRWYTVSEAASALNSLFDEPITEQDVLDIINAGDLPIWWDATGRYSVPLYPGCDFHAEREDHILYKLLGIKPTNEQLANLYSSSNLLIQGSDYAEVLFGMYRLYTEPRSDYIALPKDNNRATIDFAHGLLAVDKDGETILQILKRIEGAPPFSMVITDFWGERDAPDRSSLRIAASDIHEFIATAQAENGQPESSKAIEPSDETEKTKLLKQIGALSLLLAEKVGKYTRAGKPNASQIANDVGEIIDALSDASTSGLKSSSVRESIARGLKLINEN